MLKGNENAYLCKVFKVHFRLFLSHFKCHFVSCISSLSAGTILIHSFLILQSLVLKFCYSNLFLIDTNVAGVTRMFYNIRSTCILSIEMESVL